MADAEELGEVGLITHGGPSCFSQLPQPGFATVPERALFYLYYYCAALSLEGTRRAAHPIPSSSPLPPREGVHLKLPRRGPPPGMIPAALQKPPTHTYTAPATPPPRSRSLTGIIYGLHPVSRSACPPCGSAYKPPPAPHIHTHPCHASLTESKARLARKIFPSLTAPRCGNRAPTPISPSPHLDVRSGPPVWRSSLTRFPPRPGALRVLLFGGCASRAAARREARRHPCWWWRRCVRRVANVQCKPTHTHPHPLPLVPNTDQKRSG